MKFFCMLIFKKLQDFLVKIVLKNLCTKFEFLYANLKRNCYYIFLVKILIKKLDKFSRWNELFIFPLKEASKIINEG